MNLTADMIKTSKLESEDLVWNLEEGSLSSKTDKGKEIVKEIADVFLERK